MADISYTPTTWADGSEGGTPIDAAKLNNIESGISDAVAAIGPNDTTQDGTLKAQIDALGESVSPQALSNTVISDYMLNFDMLRIENGTNLLRLVQAQSAINSPVNSGSLLSILYTTGSQSWYMHIALAIHLDTGKIYLNSFHYGYGGWDGWKTVS